MGEFVDLITILQNFATNLRNGQVPQLGIQGYILLAVLVAIEGPIATLLGAAAASTGMMKPVLVFIAAAAGNLTADSLWYSLGYLGNIEWVLRIGRRFGLQREKLEQLERSMRQHATKVLFLAKITVSFIIPSLIAAGLVRAPWRRWFPAIFAGEMLWTGSLLVVGFYATEAITRVEKGVEYVILALSVLFLVLMIWLGRRLFAQKDIN